MTTWAVTTYNADTRPVDTRTFPSEEDANVYAAKRQAMLARVGWSYSVRVECQHRTACGMEG